VDKFWSILFGAVLAATFGIWIIAPFCGWWLPPNIASFGDKVDFLFYVILGFTGFFFILTEVILVYAMWRFARKADHRPFYTHGNHRLEVAWTIVPAVILLFIAFAQVKAWEEIKYATRMPQPDQIIEVTARQWNWNFRYPADIIRPPEKARQWGETPEADDLYDTNDLHVWKNANVRIFLKTQDVLHSFFLPNLRLKQDALPGKTIPVWFRVTESNTYFDDKTGLCVLPKTNWELACAELCGSGHYRMRGRLLVHPDKADFQRWFNRALKDQQTHKAEDHRVGPTNMVGD
jgi:cytochrome c oxidase subunit 2